MAAFDNQQSWFPEENSRDCSLGFCTIYCPQWCYALLPPPPPFSLSGNFNHHATAFSPPVITIIGILAAFFLLITYYKLVSNFCGFFYSRRNHSHHRSNPNDNSDEEESDGADNYHQESWHLPPSNGLDEAFIRKITICKFKRGEGLVEGTECSVCLSEFIEGENLRLLPKCSHAFHLQCIDPWLKSHSSCPLCRVNILSPGLASEETEQDAVVIAVRDLDLERTGDEVEEMAKDRRRLLPAGSSRRGRGERGKVRSGRSRGLLSVMSPVRMKRSVSSGRNGFARGGRRGRALLLLPVCGKAP